MTTRTLTAVLIGVFITCLATVSSADKTCDQLVEESESLRNNNDFDKSDQVLDRAIKICPERAELYWRKGRNEFDRLENIPKAQRPGKDELIERYSAVERLGEKCMALDPEDGNCVLWKGIGMGRRGTTQGVIYSLAEASQFEDFFLKAESLKPQYRSVDGSSNALADIYTVLGMYYRIIPEWLCYFPLKQLVGTCGDLAKSVEYQRKAAAREPLRIEYQKELAISLLCHGLEHDAPAEVEEGKKILKSLQSMSVIKPSDNVDKAHAKDLLADPSIACGYSRDEQQSRSKEVYEEGKE